MKNIHLSAAVRIVVNTKNGSSEMLPLKLCGLKSGAIKRNSIKFGHKRNFSGSSAYSRNMLLNSSNSSPTNSPPARLVKTQEEKDIVIFNKTF